MYTITYFESPVGLFELRGSEYGISSLKRVERRAPGYEDQPALAVLEQARDELAAYFSRRLQTFTVPLDFGQAPAFNRAVWEALLKIPYGHTSTYSAIAEVIGHPTAVRAVGMANRNNPIALIVPCHRCIAKNGDLQGYFYGLDVKRALLELENPDSFARQGSLF